jgi:hypothetical protein
MRRILQDAEKGNFMAPRESVVENALALAEINGKLDKAVQSIEYIKEKQAENAEHIKTIKSSVYEPDEGLYARLRTLEGWRETSSRLLWIIITSITTLTVAALYKMVISV